MREPVVYGEFERRDGVLFRRKCFLQWGSSTKSIGAFVGLNPGAADFLGGHQELEQRMVGELRLDHTLRQLVRLIRHIHGDEPEGRVHVYNLFSLKDPQSASAVNQLQQVRDTYSPVEDEISTHELQEHPWLLLAWGLDRSETILKSKDRWLDTIRQSGVPFFGKLHPKKNDYYHLCPRLQSDRDILLDDLVNEYKQISY
ncbi:DUF1643 domain-containing protein [Paenibacillus sp. SN-8-1]|uniref:DUF1643 domain-containing protein n=1 Tax=Paenibacillus sp. SN-8-1 TaxID=3435409 RepID=UPI003D9A6B44